MLEQWNNGFERTFSILKMPCHSGFQHETITPFSSPSPLPARRAYRPEGEFHEPEAKTHHSDIPKFHHSNGGEAP